MTPHRLADTEFHAASSHSVGYGIIYGCMRSEPGSIHKETREGERETSYRRYSGSRPRSSARADAFILQPRFLWARYYLPSLRDSDASTLRTSDWEIPNCLAMREGVIPALKAARTALTCPRVNATLGSCGCRRSGDSSVVVD